MNPVLIGAGIILSARIISFIADELTEEEIKKQKALDEKIEAINVQYQSPEALDEMKASIQNCNTVLDKKAKICNLVRAAVDSRIKDIKELYDDIDDSKHNVISALNNKQAIHTPLRKSSLELLLRQLSEAKEKAYAYRQYLMLLKDEIIRLYIKENLSNLIFHFPQKFPYVGKTIWINSTQLSAQEIEFEISELFAVSICISDKEIIEYDADTMLPIMITGGKNKHYTASAEKGAFKAYELVNTHLGVSATVKEIQKNYIILEYQQKLELYLSSYNLIKPHRFPPVRSKLTVYPVRWDFDLSGRHGYPVTVSERKEDAESSLAFKNFPLCFSKDDYAIFMNYFKSLKLEAYNKEFLIGPASQKDLTLKKGSLLKIQLGDIPLFYIEIEEHSNRSDIFRYYFRFSHMCEREERTFSADDIFLPFDVSFSPYYADTSEEMIKHYMEIDDLDDVAALIWDIFEEFRIQDQIRKTREGMSYFFKWERITNQLISVLELGDSVSLQVNWKTDEARNRVFAEILNPADLNSLINKFAAKTDAGSKYKWYPKFFVKDATDNRYKATVLNDGHGLKIDGKNVSGVFPSSGDNIELYAAKRAYPEHQQKDALRQFRIGQVANPEIQAACLNSSNIISCIDNDKKLMPFHNECLMFNESQKKAVELAYKEKNIFLIQGPPGTGKTTVIRELVEQILETDSESRVLIVSQSNVAVDNALSGFIKQHSELIVRCGNPSKISRELQNVQLQNRCHDYLIELEQRKSFFEQEFYENWFDAISSTEHSPVLCELIIRNHRLIGATCVGLANRNIGLDRTEFDLLIIDEAGKALPAELLIPLIRSKKAVIIGDQRQLPPVINPILYDEELIDLEERAISENELFCHSFFERLYDNAPDSCKMMLDTQFRMPAIIGSAISKLFYDGKLQNGVGTENRIPVLFDSNLSFINFDGDTSFQENKDKRKQITNETEAMAVISLVFEIREKDKNCKIAIITPYKGQKKLIENKLVQAGIPFQSGNIFVDTIDSFQGSEADVVVFCSTRAVTPTLFFRDSKRLNVALSRATRELIILGRLSYFYKYGRNVSCLPGLADYIKEYGKIIPASQCEYLHKNIRIVCPDEFVLAIDDISIPSEFYLEEVDESGIRAKIDEYYNWGRFLQPILVIKTKSGYLLRDSFSEFKAAMELNLSECLCKISK